MSTLGRSGAAGSHAHCESDGLRRPRLPGLAAANVVPMHRTRFIDQRGLLLLVRGGSEAGVDKAARTPAAQRERGARCPTVPGIHKSIMMLDSTQKEGSGARR